MGLFRLGDTPKLWNATMISGLTAADVTTVLEYIPGQIAGSAIFELSFSAAPTTFDCDIEYSDNNSIWRRLVNFANTAGESFSLPVLMPGFYRAKLNSVTAAASETVTLQIVAAIEAAAAHDNVEINEATGDLLGAVLRLGRSGFPIRKDTVGTTFIYGNFVNDAVSGDVKGLAITLDAGGALQTYTTAIYGGINATAVGNLRNPVAVQGDINFSDGCWIQGLGYGLGTWIHLPNNTVTTGTFTGVNIEFDVPASWVGHLNNLKHSFLRFAIGGAGEGNFEDSGYLIELAGFNEGTGNIFSAGADVAAAASLRILIGGTKYFILLGAGEST